LSGVVWSADAHERRKDGSIYTVQQTITPIINDGGVITHFVAIHEDVTSKVETHERILHLANHDALTGLPSRKLFVDRFETLYKLTKRNESKLALLFIDLDGFKQVNDTHGHHIGDLLLQEVAVRLMSCVRGSDIVARLGGDEFVTVLYDVDGVEAVASVAEKILSQMSEPFQLENIGVRIGASLGISLNHAHDQSAESLLKRADAAMYLAKKAGKNSYRFAAIENQ
jgi:diguanylate cyclase (GGDEF)-like protein